MLRYITTFVAVAIGALVMVAGAVAGKPDIVNFPPVELVGLSQHDCGDYELLLSGTLERRSRFTLDEAGQDLAERRQVKVTGTIYNASDPTKAAPYLRSIQIDQNFVTGERAIIGTTRVVVRGRRDRASERRHPHRGLDRRRLRDDLPDAPVPGRSGGHVRR